MFFPVAFCRISFAMIFSQISEESTGPPPTDEISVEEESSWIYNQLASGTLPLFGKRDSENSKEGLELSVNRDDIIRFLDLHHVQKLDVGILFILAFV